MTDNRVYILDCDTGVDDALALGYLLSNAADALLGVTTVFGNVSVDLTTRNTRDVLALAGRADLPVHTGAATSLDGRFAGASQEVHGGNGLGGITLPPSDAPEKAESAPAYLARMARKYKGRLIIIAVGPLTNLAIALTMDPAMADSVAGLVIMGGAIQHPGNMTPAAEANIWHDPEAAARVLGSGIPIRLVPLDATMRQRLTVDDQAALASAPGRTPRLLARAVDHYLGFYSGIFGTRECALHDPLAAAIALDPSLILTEAVTHVSVQLGDGPGRGQTIADLRTHYLGSVHLPNATTSIVLDTSPDFPANLVASLVNLP